MGSEGWDISTGLNTVKDLQVYHLLLKLSEKFTRDISTKEGSKLQKRIFYQAFEILLKKSKKEILDLPENWDDEDVRLSLYWELYQRYKKSNNCTEKEFNKIVNIFESLQRISDTEFYECSVGPVLRMFLGIALSTRHKDVAPRKESDGFFDPGSIKKMLKRTKSVLSKQENSFFPFPYAALAQSRSDTHLSIYTRFKDIPSSWSFDNISNSADRNGNAASDKGDNKGDEGFVSPSDNHQERPLTLQPIQLRNKLKKCVKKFEWEPSVVLGRPSRHKSWECYRLPLTKREPPWLPKEILHYQWLATAPHNITKVDKNQFFEDLKALLIGVRSSTFIEVGDTFKLKEGVYTEDLTPEAVAGLCAKLIEGGSAFRALSQLAESMATTDEDTVSSGVRMALRHCLSTYHGRVTQLSGTTNYTSYCNTVRPLVDHITALRSVLMGQSSLRGTDLLEHIFHAMEKTCDPKLFHALATLYLVPCSRYFSLLDDWVFLGKWHRDLPIGAPGDEGSMKDRPSWLHSSNLLSSSLPWWVPGRQLAAAGKALPLLALSRSNEDFLKLMKSDLRPKIKLCLKQEDLNELKASCRVYYETAKKTFKVWTSPSDDVAESAARQAELYQETFTRMKEEKLEMVQRRKQEELALRKEDLVRSGRVRAARREAEEAEDMRVAAEIEEILKREKDEELEKAKILYEKYKKATAILEKQQLKAEWKIKRLELSKKRKEFIIQEQLVLEEELLNSAKTEGKSEPIREKIEENVSLQTGPEVKDIERGEKSVEIKVNDIEAEIGDKCEEKLIDGENVNEFERNRKMDVYRDNTMDVLPTKVADMKAVRTDKVGENVTKGEIVNEFERNRKMDINSYNMMDVLPTKVADTKAVGIDKVGENVIEGEIVNEFERNRNKILGSDLGKGGHYRTHEWSEEAERNKKKMLSSSHFCFESYQKPIVCKEGASEEVEKKIRISEKIKPTCREEFVVDKETSVVQDEKSVEKTVENIDVSKSCDVEETVDVGTIKESGDMKLRKNEGKKGNFLKEYIKTKNEQWTMFFHDVEPECLLEGPLDLLSIHKLIPASLACVLEVQTSLVNQALLGMFLGEYQLVGEVERLKKYFFLAGDFGLRLSTALSAAVESEQPAYLLTFGRLRNILTESARTDLGHLSFVVKETPVAFDHIDPQVLSCLDLSYKFEWPLNLILTDQAISKYNKIFVYMISLQRVSWHLEQVWHTLNIKCVQLRGYQYTQVQYYRFVMVQFVTSLRSYIVSMVSQSCWQDFTKSITKITDIGELYQTHAGYIKNIIVRCFLDERSKKLMTQINRLLRHILTYCRTLRFGEWSLNRHGEYQHAAFTKLKKAFENFLALARYVTQYINKFAKSRDQKELYYLYSFLTFNSFYL